jgi:hypothetical protein
LWIDGLGIDCTFVISAPASLAEVHGQNQANKKPGLNKGSAGITSVPGLFSELFNVAASRPAQMTTECAKASPGQAFRQGWGMVNRPGKPHGAAAPLRHFAPWVRTGLILRDAAHALHHRIRQRSR